MARKQQTPAAVAPAAPVARKGRKSPSKAIVEAAIDAEFDEAAEQVETGETAEQVETGERPLSQWAAERARAMQGEGRAAARFERLAVVLGEAATAGKGKPVTLRFAEVNAATGDRRGEGAADASARWVSALAKLRQLSGGALPGFTAKVDREAGCIVVTAESA